MLLYEGNISGRFLKDGVDILAIPVTQISNLTIKLSHFLNKCKLAKLKGALGSDDLTVFKEFRAIFSLKKKTNYSIFAFV